jgi:nitroimidazol reductase NimA-like FMN-containing flavoprotein (pyridoxamine 5'-phosphate oxidase superfamily)
MRVRKRHAEFLAGQRVVHVATADARGRPHVVPVCAVMADARLYFASAADGRKMRDLRANPHVAVVADDYAESWSGLRGVVVHGTARVFPRGPRFRRVRKLLYAKYPQYPTEAALEEGDAVVVEVTPTRLFSWGF